MDETTNKRLEQFRALSELLLDVEDLRRPVARVYLSMLDDLDADWPLDDMAIGLIPLGELPPDERERRIVADLRVHLGWHDAAVNVLQVWYSGSLNRANGDAVPQPPAAYIGALCWSLLQTEAPGLPGPFFGEWAYPPTRASSPIAVPAVLEPRT